MLIAQITDLHLGAKRGDPGHSNEARLDAVIARLLAMEPQPDLLLVTGDMSEGGDPASYRSLAERLGAFRCPVLFAMGNHDRRDALHAELPQVPLDDGFVHYAYDAGALRILVLDSVDEDRHGGAFCSTRANWLRTRLAEEPDRPTIIVLHHPPIESGIGWMTIAPHEPWVERLAEGLDGFRNVVALLTGHLHRPMVSSCMGITVAVCPSTAPPVALELAPIETDRPDGRPLVLADPPGYALHLWTGDRLISHFETAVAHEPLVSFDAAMQPLIEKLVHEPSGP
jgi:Icc protein